VVFCSNHRACIAVNAYNVITRMRPQGNQCTVSACDSERQLFCAYTLNTRVRAERLRTRHGVRSGIRTHASIRRPERLRTRHRGGPFGIFTPKAYEHSKATFNKLFRQVKRFSKQSKNYVQMWAHQQL